MGDISNFVTWLPGYQAGVQARANRDRTMLAVQELEQRKVEAMNRVANDAEHIKLLQQQQEIARMNAMTHMAEQERLTTQQQFVQQKALDKEQRGQQFRNAVQMSIDDMTTPQVPMARQPATMDQQARAVQDNLTILQDPQMFLEGMRAVTGMKAEARQEKEKTRPDSYDAIPIVDKKSGKTVGYQGPTGFIPLQEAVTVYDDNGNKLGTSFPPRTKVDKPGSGLNLGRDYGIDSRSVTNSVKKPFIIRSVSP